ncbi:hypothetical protein STEG23_009312 [Scotinomys teguina]
MQEDTSSEVPVACFEGSQRRSWRNCDSEDWEQERLSQLDHQKATSTWDTTQNNPGNPGQFKTGDCSSSKQLGMRSPTNVVIDIEKVPPTKPSGTLRGDLACTMKVWLFACLVTCFVWAWVPVVHVQGAFEDCCLGYQPRVKWNILQHAKHYHKQEVSGSCNLRAVIFHFRQKGKVCVNPEDKDVKRAIKFLNAKNKRVDNSQKTTTDLKEEIPHESSRYQ